MSQHEAVNRLPGMDSPSYPGALLPASERVWQAFLAALDDLPAPARTVLLLHDVLGASIDDIAYLLDVDLPTCRQQLEQARACLQPHRQHLESGTS